MDLYQPLYVPRPTVEPERFASLRPPTYGGAMTNPGQVGERGQVPPASQPGFQYAIPPFNANAGPANRFQGQLGGGGFGPQFGLQGGNFNNLNGQVNDFNPRNFVSGIT